VQRSAAGPAAAVAPPSVNAVVASPGRALDGATRGFFESQFQHDFSNVRIHTDHEAAASARVVNAYAYTVGDHIVFDHGQYDPVSPRGRQLLAHELTHTVQQGGLQRAPSGPLPMDGGSEDASLEREAEDMAESVAHRTPTPAVTKKQDRHGVSRVPRTWTPVPVTSPIGALVTDEEAAPTDPAGHKAYRMRAPFQVPSKKGPVLPLYQAKAAAQALEATINFQGSPNAGLWQSRASTADLRDDWLMKVGWTRAQAAQEWYNKGGEQPAAGGFPTTNPRAGGSLCDMDHMVELQLGGTNERENVAPLNSQDNRDSGREIWLYVSGLALQIHDQVTPQPRDITLHWDAVTQTPAVTAPTACSAPGAAPNCSAVDACAVANRPAAVTAEGATTQGLENYTVTVAASQIVFRVAPGAGTTDLLNSAPENANSAEAIPGLILTRLERREPQHRDEIQGGLESTTMVKRTRPTRVPMVIQNETNAIPFQVIQQGTNRTLRMQTTSRALQFVYPYLSPGELTHLSLDPAHGVRASGVIRPSIPLLNQIQVAYSDGNLSGSLGIDPRRFRSPIPGLRLTRADITGTLTPEFSIAGDVEFEVGRAVRGTLHTGVENGSFAAHGTLTAAIPGVNNAQGNVDYTSAGFSGGVHVSSDQIPIPGIQSGSVDVTFNERGVEATGQVSASIPGQDEPVTLGIRRNRAGQFTFFGSTTFHIPRLRPLNVNVEYDGTHFSGSGSTGVTVGGFDGTLNAAYRDGRFSGAADLHFHRGRADGTVHVQLSPQGRISGSGTITYPLTQTLIGTVGVALSEEGQVRVTGELVFARPIRLFDGFQRQFTVFEMPQVQIPILAIPIGTRSVGLVGTIDARLGASLGIGPGELLDTRARAAFNPLDENPNVDIELGTTINVPAHAGLSFTVRGGIGLSAGIASVTGGLSITGSVNLDGGFRSPLSLTYHQGVILAEAHPQISASLVLGLDLTADVTAQVGAFGLGVEKRWEFPIDNYSWDTGLGFSLDAPIRWASNEPFHAPSLSDIHFQRPQLNVDALLPSLFGAANRRES
jgi:hypothetical protein